MWNCTRPRNYHLLRKKSSKSTDEITSQNDASNAPQLTAFDECVMKYNDNSNRYKKRVTIKIENTIAKKLACDESNPISSVKGMQGKFPNFHKQWTIIHLLKHTKLTRHLNSDQHNFSVIQEMLTSESGNDKHLFKIKLITPVLLHDENLEIDDEMYLK